MLLTEDGVDGVHGDLVLGGISDQTLGVGEGNIRRGCSVTLIIGDDLYTIVLPYSYARVSGTQIDSNSRSLTLAGHLSDQKSRESNENIGK